MALYPQFRDSTVFIEDDFIEDTISTTRWNLAADGTATTFVWTAAAGGTIQGSTGGTDNGYHAINGDVIWSGDKNAGCAIRFKMDVVTGFTFELGFTDALGDETLPAVTDVSLCWTCRPWWRLSNWVDSLVVGAAIGVIAGLLAAFHPRAAR